MEGISYTSPSQFAEVQLKLLQLEREAEIERNKDLLFTAESQHLSLKKSAELEKKGLGLRKLQISEWTTSAFGKNLTTLGKANASDLPASSITNGKNDFFWGGWGPMGWLSKNCIRKFRLTLL